MRLDTLIRGATVYDGEEVEPRSVAVGIRGDRIALVGEAPIGAAADEVIDAHGLYLCPGFIDTHASTGLGYTLPRAGDHKLHQGVTTEVIGNCGTSSGPIGEPLIPTMERLAAEIGFDFDWRRLGEWFGRVESYGLPFNVGTFVGHSTLRAGACVDAREVDAEQRRRLAELLESGLEDGAMGLSTGLIYAPGSYADTSEIVELARIAARYRGLYVSHIRDERQGLEDAVDEAIEIGSQAELPVLISHLKAAERPNWGKIPAILERIEAVRADGQPVSFEVYPYAAVSTKLRAFLPNEALADGVEALPELLATAEWRRRSVSWLRERGTDFDAMVLITQSLPGARGRSVSALGSRLGSTEPAETAVDVLIADPDAWMVYHCIDETDMDLALLWPHSIVCSDSWSYPVNATNSIGDPHPRTYGAFTRFLERYALRQERLPFGHAIQKITSFPADWLGIPRRGRIREGWYADLALLDPERVRERATFEQPRQNSEGTVGVWVNGCRMVADGEVGSELPGCVLRRDVRPTAGTAPS